MAGHLWPPELCLPERQQLIGPARRRPHLPSSSRPPSWSPPAGPLRLPRAPRSVAEPVPVLVQQSSSSSAESLLLLLLLSELGWPSSRLLQLLSWIRDWSALSCFARHLLEVGCSSILMTVMNLSRAQQAVGLRVSESRDSSWLLSLSLPALAKRILRIARPTPDWSPKRSSQCLPQLPVATWNCQHLGRLFRLHFPWGQLSRRSLESRLFAHPEAALLEPLELDLSPSAGRCLRLAPDWSSSSSSALPWKPLPDARLTPQTMAGHLSLPWHYPARGIQLEFAWGRQ